METSRGPESQAAAHPSSSTDMAEILIVDDEESIRRLLQRILGVKYKCTLASNALEARERLKERNFELVLCDLRMPGESGMDFIRHLLTEHPDTAAVVVSVVGDQETTKRALEAGVYGYIIKPFEPEEVLVNAANALRRRQLEIDNRRQRQNLEQLVAQRTVQLQEREERLRHSLQELRRAMEGMIQAMAVTVERRDPYTAGHQRRVAELAAATGSAMHLSGHLIEGIRMAGVVHDVGKIAIPAEILSKPGRLSEVEFMLIKDHPAVGYEILKEIDFPWPIANMVRQHHERLDGSGYPQGLSGESIDLGARILGVADVVEAMASHRPYRPALGIDKALEEISRNEGKSYDPVVVEACLTLFRMQGFDWGTGTLGSAQKAS